MKAPAYFLPLLLPIFFVPSKTFTGVLHAQAPAAGASVAVRTIDPIDSSKDPAGKQYRVSVTNAVDAGNGVTIPQGSVAALTLTHSGNGSGWTTQLVSVSINGQPVAVASGPASVTSAAQTAAGSALGAMNSVLGGFGHHVSAPSGVTAVAMGQRVVLPPGATLTFVLTQPPAAGPAAPGQAAPPSGQPMMASAASAPGPSPAAAPDPSPAAAPAPGSGPAAAPTPGQLFISCSTSEDGGIDTYYTGVFAIRARPGNPGGQRFPMGGYIGGTWMMPAVPTQTVLDHFQAYLTQKGYKFKPGSDSACDVKPTEAATQAAQHKRAYDQGGCSTCGKVVETGWKDGSGEASAPAAQPMTASAAPVVHPSPAAAMPTAAASTGGPFISCSTSGGAGIDTYYTAVFQTTKPVRHLPNGGNLVDQSVLDNFYAYLKQKGYNFKPGSNYGCVVGPTDATVQAEHQKRTANNGGCSNCGKVVETGWKDTP